MKVLILQVLYDAGLLGTLLGLFVGTLVVICCYLASKIEVSHVPAEYEESEAPSGLQRLFKSETYKTGFESSDLSSIRFHRKRPIPGVAQALSEVDPSEDISIPRKLIQKRQELQVKVLRGGEFIGNRMRFKVKILNDSPYTITDVTVFLLSYPKSALKLESSEDSAFFSKIEPGGFRSPSFDFLPTQDCVKGEIVAGVSFLDIQGNPQMKNTKPFIIRSVCDLLLPHRVSPQDFELKLKHLECGEIVVKIEEWTPEEMFEKALRIVDESNFFEVDSKTEESNGVLFSKITGYAKGKYTGKEIGVEIDISGQSGKKGPSCTLRVSGEDQAMILPAIDDLRERLNAWLCPMCSSPLSLDNVEALRDGKIVECSFCKVSIGR